jgi:glycerol uptake facilitator-like aquaporin
MALQTSFLKTVFAEFFGTFLLVTVVVGSGIMGTLMSTDDGIALIINTISTIFALWLLIVLLGPISGAHFNPVVSLVMFVRGDLSLKALLAYIPNQIAGAILGAITANAMFGTSFPQVSNNYREGFGILLGEVIATAGLLLVILLLSDSGKSQLIPVAVAAWIGSAYFFTSSTSFANPAVTIGRIFTDTFSGIAVASAGPFILAQLIGGFVGLGLFLALRVSKS